MTRRRAIFAALLVTFLWSTSWVLIKIGLQDLDIRPLSFAGLRYVLAALVLLPLAWPAWRRVRAAGVAPRTVGFVAALGVVTYAVTQGAQFAALVYLPAVGVALALSTTPVLVALASRRGSEPPSALQLVGTLGVVLGAALYFGPLELGPAAWLGLAIAGVGVLANAASAILGRVAARDVAPAVGGVLALTALSMCVGSVLLLGLGVAVEGLPQLSVDAWLVVGWLAVVNTAFAFTLWNHTLRTLTALESSVLNNLMLIQVAVLAWVFLDEMLDARQIAGLAIVLVGILVVQLAGRAGRARATAAATSAAATSPVPPPSERSYP